MDAIVSHLQFVHSYSVKESCANYIEENDSNKTCDKKYSVHNIYPTGTGSDVELCNAKSDHPSEKYSRGDDSNVKNDSCRENSDVNNFEECYVEPYAEDIYCVENVKEEYCMDNPGEYQTGVISVPNDDNQENQYFNQPLSYQDLNLIYADDHLLHVCDVCNRSFRKKSNLKRHYRSHTGDNPHQCDQCNARFPTMSRLKEHLNTHSGLRPYTCNLCQKTFARPSNLTRHYRTHNGEKTYECDLCDSRFIEATRLREHYLTHVGEKKFACDVCDKRFLKKYNLKRHYRTHTGEHPHSCNICDRYFSKRIYLLVHLETHATKKVNQSSPQQPALKECGGTSTLTNSNGSDNPSSNTEKVNEIGIKHNDLDVISHSTDNHDDKLFSCKQCGRHYIKESSLTAHLQKHIEKDPLKCEVCNASFTHVSRLREHFVTHSGEKPFPCIICGRRFGRNSNLLRHLLTHTGEKRHECNTCKKKFSNGSRLKEHYLSHSGEKPHHCKVCNKFFRHKFGLQRHYLTHTGEKPHKCDLCAKRFSRRSRLSAHYRTHGRVLPLNHPSTPMNPVLHIPNKVEPRLTQLIESLEARLSEQQTETFKIKPYSACEDRTKKHYNETIPDALDELEEVTVEITFSEPSSLDVSCKLQNISSPKPSALKRRAEGCTTKSPKVKTVGIEQQIKPGDDSSTVEDNPFKSEPKRSKKTKSSILCRKKSKKHRNKSKTVASKQTKSAVQVSKSERNLSSALQNILNSESDVKQKPSVSRRSKKLKPVKKTICTRQEEKMVDSSAPIKTEPIEIDDLSIYQSQSISDNLESFVFIKSELTDPTA